jgi:hypothetical protein
MAGSQSAAVVVTEKERLTIISCRCSVAAGFRHSLGTSRHLSGPGPEDLGKRRVDEQNFGSTDVTLATSESYLPVQCP